MNQHFQQGRSDLVYSERTPWMIWCHNPAAALNSLLCLDILFPFERIRWSQSGKYQLSLSIFFKFLVPEDWIFLSCWKQDNLWVSWILLFWFMVPLWRLGHLEWMSDLWWLPWALESKWEFPSICWNLESKAKIYSSSCRSSIPSKVTLGKMLISFEFQFQHFCIGMQPTSEGLLWELNERKYRMHTAWYIGCEQY